MWFGLGSKNDAPPTTIHIGSENQDLQNLDGTPQYPPLRVNRQDVFALHTKQQILLEQIHTLFAHLEGVNRNLGVAEAKLLETDLELGTLKESRNEVQRAIKSLTADSVKRIEDRRQVCVRDIGQLQKEIKDNDSAITSLSDRLTALVFGNKEKDRAKLALANQIASHRQTAQKLTATIRVQGLELTSLVAQRSEQNLDEATIVQLDKNLQSLHREVALGTGQLRAELESVDSLNQQVADLHLRINSNSVKLHALRRTLPEMQNAAKLNQTRLKELQDENTKLEKEMEAALKRIKTLEGDLTTLEKKILVKQQARVDATATFETLHQTQISTMMQFAELQTQQLAVATEVDKLIRQTLPTESVAQAASSCPARCVSIDKPVDGKLTATKVLMMYEETVPEDSDPEKSFRLCVEVFEIVSCKMYRQKKPAESPIDGAPPPPTDATKSSTDLAPPETSPRTSIGSKSPRSTTTEKKRPANAASYLVVELKPGYHNLFAASKPSSLFGRRASLPGRRGSFAEDKKSPPRRSSGSDLPPPLMQRQLSRSGSTSLPPVTTTTTSSSSTPPDLGSMRRKSIGSVSSIDFEFPDLQSPIIATTTTIASSSSSTISLDNATSSLDTQESTALPTTTTTHTTEVSSSSSTSPPTEVSTALAGEADTTTTITTTTTNTAPLTTTISTSTLTTPIPPESPPSTAPPTAMMTMPPPSENTIVVVHTGSESTTDDVKTETEGNSTTEIFTTTTTSTTTTTTSDGTTTTTTVPTVNPPSPSSSNPPPESPGLPLIPPELERLKSQPPQEPSTFSRLRGFFAHDDKKDTVRFVFKGERSQLTAICVSLTQSLAELNKAELSQNHPAKDKSQKAQPMDEDMPAIDWALIGAVQGGPDVAVNLSAGDSEILTVPQLKRLTCLAPFRSCIGGSWNLVYSLTRDGVSLSSFYHAMQGIQSSIFVIRDETKKVFGGFSNEEWKIHEGYYGSADCFVFEISQKSGLRTYRWTGGNTFFLHSNGTTLAFGGGSHFALSLNSTLDKGVSGPCETYGNPQLSTNHAFDIRLFEVWGIVPDPDD